MVGQGSDGDFTGYEKKGFYFSGWDATGKDFYSLTSNFKGLTTTGGH